MAAEQRDVASATTGGPAVEQQSSDLETRLSSLELRVERLAGVMRKLVEGMKDTDEAKAIVSRVEAIERRLSADPSVEAAATNGNLTTRRTTKALTAENASNVSAQLARSTQHLTEARKARVRRRSGKRRNSTPSVWRRLARPRMS